MGFGYLAVSSVRAHHKDSAVCGVIDIGACLFFSRRAVLAYGIKVARSAACLYGMSTAKQAAVA